MKAFEFTSDITTGLENIIIFSKISKYRKYQKYHDVLFDIFDIFDIFQKMKLLRKSYNNVCNTILMQYLMTINLVFINRCGH